MALVLDILRWGGIAAASLGLAGLVLIGAMAWLLNHPFDDDDPEKTAGRC